ncbi:hypothetical protein Ccrd_011465, partial [Cynara cardunculus var. scolymus]
MCGFNKKLDAKKPCCSPSTPFIYVKSHLPSLLARFSGEHTSLDFTFLAIGCDEFTTSIYRAIDNIRKEAEAETRLPMDPMLLSPATGISDGNNFLHEWGSGDEEPFQKHMDRDKVACLIPTPRPIKFESDSVVTVQAGPYFAGTSTSESCDQGIKEHRRFFKEEAEEITNAESQNSYEPENASDITLDLLLDFPNDGEYLQNKRFNWDESFFLLLLGGGDRWLRLALGFHLYLLGFFYCHIFVEI